MERATEIGHKKMVSISNQVSLHLSRYKERVGPTANHLRFTIKVSGDWTRKVREALEVGTEVLVREWPF